MISQFQRRPWSIHAYALVALAVGLDAYIGALLDLGGWELAFEDMTADIAPRFAWTRDWTIVALSARFTIVCIPVAAIWIWGARFARTLVTLFTFFLLVGLIRTLAQGTPPLETEAVIKTLFLGLACALLFTPSAGRWLKPVEQEPVTRTFE
ncbi:MAG: hypothetical protein AAF692_07635 [Pseudomonadota bacterium]